MRINLAMLLLATGILSIFVTYLREVPVWIQSHWLWDQAQWMLLQLALIALWIVWLVATILTFIIKRVP